MWVDLVVILVVAFASFGIGVAMSALLDRLDAGARWW